MNENRLFLEEPTTGKVHLAFYDDEDDAYRVACDVGKDWVAVYLDAGQYHDALAKDRFCRTCYFAVKIVDAPEVQQHQEWSWR